MLRMRFDAGRLYELGRRRRLPPRTDLGYLLHCELRELFGAESPAPFAVRDAAGRGVTVLGYSSRPAAALQRHAQQYADPDVYAACDWTSLDEKPLPQRWAADERLGFEVRACPVVRMSSDGPRWRAGAEVDAYLARCWRTEGPVEREAVYREWLLEELRRRGGARLISARVMGHQRAHVVRRDHRPERKAVGGERPEAVFSGELEVADPEAFGALLARGVGRHRGFGFGMLLLRPPG
jgi:CRISPR system Cascade subunit CasE